MGALIVTVYPTLCIIFNAQKANYRTIEKIITVYPTLCIIFNAQKANYRTIEKIFSMENGLFWDIFTALYFYK